MLQSAKSSWVILFLSLTVQTARGADFVPVKFSNEPARQEFIGSTQVNNITYISAKDLVRALSGSLFENVRRGKIVIYFSNHRTKVSANSSFIVMDDEVYQMPTHALLDGEEIFIPMESFLHLFSRFVAPTVLYDPIKKQISVELLAYNLTGITVEEKANGTLIRIKTTRPFDTGSLSSWFAQNGWFYLTVAGGIADISSIKKIKPTGIIREITVDQIGKTAQIAFHLRAQVESHEIYQNPAPSEILITLRAPLSYTAEKIKKLRDRWYIDTIVLDPGHGGKDTGAIGKYGLQEKFVTLDIAKRIGRLLEKNTNMKVAYTRDEDVFIPLWSRTKTANESGGKIFVSIHANANENSLVRGFETFFLKPGKSEDAIEVSQRENAAIKLEEETSRYKDLLDDNFIVASLMQNSFMKESEDFASLIQQELKKQIPSPDRGVKQAGFYVLIGASMPNILVEVGFLSNPHEEKQLRKPGYRQTIAQAIYEGIKKFKEKYESVLAEESKG